MPLTVTFKFNLGDEVVDTIPVYPVIVVSRTDYLTGCCHYGVQSRTLKDGKRMDPEWFDGSQLEVVAEGTLARGKNGGPSPNPPSM